MISLLSPDEAKASARRLRRALAARGVEVGHSASLELFAAMHGARDWNTYLGVAAGPAGRVADPQTRVVLVPVLRIFDWDLARAWYVDYLGWSVEWLRRGGDHLPVYARVVDPGGGAVVELSEHHGDGTPGAVLVLTVDDLDPLHERLAARAQRYAAPELEQHDGDRSLTVYDPFGNRITFREPSASSGRVPDGLSPIVTEVHVAVDPSAAFAAFADLDWWRDYGRTAGAPVVIEGGEVIFRNPDGDMSIGAVTAWLPGERYAQTFTLAQDPDHPTTLTAWFAAEASGTAVRLEHGGWDATNASRRAHFTDWPTILTHYRDHVRAAG